MISDPIQTQTMDISKGTVTIKRNVYGNGPIKTLPPTELVQELTDNNSDLNGSFQINKECTDIHFFK